MREKWTQTMLESKFMLYKNLNELM